MNRLLACGCLVVLVGCGRQSNRPSLAESSQVDQSPIKEIPRPLPTAPVTVRKVSDGQPKAAEKAEKPTVSAPTRSLKEVLEDATNPKLSKQDREEAYNAVFSFRPEERNKGLREIISRGDADIAPAAAAWLLADGEKNLAPLIGPRVLEWSLPDQAAILGGVLSQTEPWCREGHALLELPRKVLSAIIMNRPQTEKSQNAMKVVSVAVLCLSNYPTAEDRKLLQNTAKDYPGVSQVWLALAQSKNMGANEQALAKKVSADPKNGERTRMSAAVALAPFDKEAGAYVEKETRAFLARFGKKDWAAFVVELYTNSKQNKDVKKDAKEFDYFNDHLFLLGMIRFLHTPAAERLAFDCTQSVNYEIRELGGLIAVSRWPEKFLRAGQGKFEPREEYPQLLAFLLLHHPEYAKKNLKQLTQPEVQKEVKKLRETGLPAWIASNVFLGF